MAATLVTGLVIEAFQKIVSRCSGIVLAWSRKPAARRYATLPFRAIAATAPEKAPASTCDCCQAAIRASRDEEKPSASGSLTGVVSKAWAAVAQQSTNSVARGRRRGFIGRPLPACRENPVAMAGAIMSDCDVIRLLPWGLRCAGRRHKKIVRIVARRGPFTLPL